MRRIFTGFILLFAIVTPLRAQDSPPAGISLTGRYSAVNRPGVSVRPFAGIGAAPSLLDTISRVINRDLTYSDRYTMIAPTSTLVTGPIDYKAWTSLGTSYLVTGDVIATAGGYELALTVHDVPYARVKDVKRYRIPGMTAGDFRMVLHAAADEVVRVITNEPGSAATRVAFTRQNKATTSNGTSTYDLLIVDSDGYGLKRLVGGSAQLYSPNWSPDGRKIVYALGGSQIVERDPATGATRVLRSEPGLQTPTYSPDGRRISYAAWISKKLASGKTSADAELFEFDASTGGNVRRLTNALRDDFGAAYSPDGRSIVFTTSRLGLPHIYMMPVTGGDPQLLSPYVVGRKGYYFSPDWSPTSSEIVFSGHWDSQGVFQILLADATRPGGQVDLLTTNGDNEDPSWAPDGKHVVYSSGVGDQQLSLYVIDTATKTKRLLVDGGKLRMSDWSPVIARAADYVVR
jgi:TolB protein